MKTKNEMIKEITEINSTVSEDFLDAFSRDDLAEYLERLRRIGGRAWIAWEPEFDTSVPAGT